MTSCPGCRLLMMHKCRDFCQFLCGVPSSCSTEITCPKSLNSSGCMQIRFGTVLNSREMIICKKGQHQISEAIAAIKVANLTVPEQASLYLE